MMLSRHAVVSGQWLFRWRSYLPLVLVVVIAPAIVTYTSPTGSYTSDLVWELCCLGLAVVGLLIRCITVGYSRAGTSGRNTHGQRADALNTDGIYSIVRNPLYVGNYFMMLGPCLFVGVWWVSVIYTLLFWLYYERIIMTEEDYLHGKFGVEYEQYADRTPAVFPKFSLWTPPQLAFSVRDVLRREYSGLLGMIVSFLIVEVATQWRVTGRLTAHPIWLAILSFGVVVYLVLRTLRKSTILLEVEDR